MLKLTKTGIGLLTRQYRSVLRKCFLINVGLFALGAAVAMVPNEAMAEKTTFNDSIVVEGDVDGYIASFEQVNIVDSYNILNEDGLAVHDGSVRVYGNSGSTGTPSVIISGDEIRVSNNDNDSDDSTTYVDPGRILVANEDIGSISVDWYGIDISGDSLTFKLNSSQGATGIAFRGVNSPEYTDLATVGWVLENAGGDVSWSDISGRPDMSDYVQKAGDTMSGELTFTSNKKGIRIEDSSGNSVGVFQNYDGYGHINLGDGTSNKVFISGNGRASFLNVYINQGGVLGFTEGGAVQINNSSGTAVSTYLDGNRFKLNGSQYATGIDFASNVDNGTETHLATVGWVEAQSYLTEHQSLAGYATENWVDNNYVAKTGDTMTGTLTIDTSYRNVILGGTQAFNASSGSAQAIIDFSTTGGYLRLTNATGGDGSGMHGAGIYVNGSSEANGITSSNSADTNSRWLTTVDWVKGQSSLTNYYTKLESRGEKVAVILKKTEMPCIKNTPHDDK